MLGEPEGTVKSRIRSGLKRMRVELRRRRHRARRAVMTELTHERDRGAAGRLRPRRGRPRRARGRRSAPARVPALPGRGGRAPRGGGAARPRRRAGARGGVGPHRRSLEEPPPPMRIDVGRRRRPACERRRAGRGRCRGHRRARAGRCTTYANDNHKTQQQLAAAEAGRLAMGRGQPRDVRDRAHRLVRMTGTGDQRGARRPDRSMAPGYLLAGRSARAADSGVYEVWGADSQGALTALGSMEKSGVSRSSMPAAMSSSSSSRRSRPYVEQPTTAPIMQGNRGLEETADGATSAVGGGCSVRDAVGDVRRRRQRDRTAARTHGSALPFADRLIPARDAPGGAERRRASSEEERDEEPRRSFFARLANLNVGLQPSRRRAILRTCAITSAIASRRAFKALAADGGAVLLGRAGQIVLARHPARLSRAPRWSASSGEHGAARCGRALDLQTAQRPLDRDRRSAGPVHAPPVPTRPGRSDAVSRRPRRDGPERVGVRRAARRRRRRVLEQRRHAPRGDDARRPAPCSSLRFASTRGVTRR